MKKPELLATVFSDYICPFCYIGDLRLQRLMQTYDLKIRWCFVEIHPDNPPEGRPVSELGYSDVKWQQMMTTLQQMADAEGVTIQADRMTTNSHKALLLAEAAKAEGKQTFYQLHYQLFSSYFSEGKNIGDPDILRQIANDCGISNDVVDHAWQHSEYEQCLQKNLMAASELGFSGVPGFLIGERKLEGAVSLVELQKSAKLAIDRA